MNMEIVDRTPTPRKVNTSNSTLSSRSLQSQSGSQKTLTKSKSKIPKGVSQLNNNTSTAGGLSSAKPRSRSKGDGNNNKGSTPGGLSAKPKSKVIGYKCDNEVKILEGISSIKCRPKPIENNNEENIRLPSPYTPSGILRILGKKSTKAVVGSSSKTQPSKPDPKVNREDTITIETHYEQVEASESSFKLKKPDSAKSAVSKSSKPRTIFPTFYQQPKKRALDPTQVKRMALVQGEIETLEKSLTSLGIKIPADPPDELDKVPTSYRPPSVRRVDPIPGQVQKKTDKVFKSAGPGHTLKDSGQQSARNPHQQQGQAKGSGRHQQAAGPSDERKAAAAAALSRLEKNKKPGDVDPQQLQAKRQATFIKEQARKELEAEREKEAEEAKSKGGTPGDTTREEPSERRSNDPEALAVSGVFFTCPLIGPEILTKAEIEDNIKRFLLEQPDEELGVTACLLIHSCNKPFEKTTNCIETVCKYVDNIIQNPDEQKFRKIKCSNKVFQDKVASVLGAEQFLRAAGFKKTMMKSDASSQEEEFWLFEPELPPEEFVAHLIELRDMLKQTTPIKAELDRNVQVLMPAQVKQRRDLPDEFYSLSLEEVRKEQQMRSELAEKETILRTKAMRERDEAREQRLYKYGVMRVRFPDGLTLQGTFKAQEKLSTVYDFVKENIIHHKEVTFELIRSGSDDLNNMDATLAELKLTPASLLNFKINTAPPVLANGEISFLRPDLLALVRPME